jgi:transposase
MGKARAESWAVSDEFWARVEPLIPARVAAFKDESLRKRRAGACRPAKPARQVFEAVMFVLRTGCQWKALPKERFGSASSVHKRFLEWEQAGFFESLWRSRVSVWPTHLEAP